MGHSCLPFRSNRDLTARVGGCGAPGSTSKLSVQFTSFETERMVDVLHLYDIGVRALTERPHPPSCSSLATRVFLLVVVVALLLIEPAGHLASPRRAC